MSRTRWKRKARQCYVVSANSFWIKSYGPTWDAVLRKKEQPTRAISCLLPNRSTPRALIDVAQKKVKQFKRLLLKRRQRLRSKRLHIIVTTTFRGVPCAQIIIIITNDKEKEVKEMRRRRRRRHGLRIGNVAAGLSLSSVRVGGGVWCGCDGERGPGAGYIDSNLVTGTGLSSVT